MKIQDIFKNYWYYSGAWHNADCDFIRFDEGVCNCRTGKNQDKIDFLLEKFLSQPTKVEFYDKKHNKIVWKKTFKYET